MSCCRVHFGGPGRRVVTAGGKGLPLTVTSAEGLGRKDGVRAVCEAEGFALAVTKKGVTLAGADRSGIYYGAGALAQLIEGDGLLPNLFLTITTLKDRTKYKGGAHTMGNGVCPFLDAGISGSGMKGV